MAARRFLILALMIGAATTAVAGVHHHKTRPCPQCGIPDGNYQYGVRSRSESAVSKTAVLVRKSTVVAEDAISQVPPVLARSEIRNTDMLKLWQDKERNQTRLKHTMDEAFEEVTPEGSRRLRSNIDNLEVLPAPEPERGESALQWLSRNLVGRAEADRRRRAEPPPPKPTHIDDRVTFSDTLTVNAPVPELPRKTVIDLYQLDRPNLQIEHCQISQVALQLHDDGQWVLSLRADQNRRPDEGQPAAFNPDLHIKRNQFFVRLRCLGNFQNEPANASLAAGKPVLVELNPSEFWVENGQPKYVRTGGFNLLVKDYFDDVDRVEIEFFYR